MSLPIGVLISGTGTNLQAIIDKIEQGILDAKIKVVISNNPSAFGIKRAKDHNIPCEVIDHRKFPSREDHEKRVVEVLESSGAQVIVLAGYMRLLSKFIINKFSNRILNIHPSILPSFKGIEAQKQAFDYGVKISGATVHFVDEHLDHGPIIIQSAVSVLDNDYISLANRILKTEHRIYPQAIQWIAENRIKIVGRKVEVKDLGKKKFADISDLQPCIINPPLEEGF